MAHREILPRTRLSVPAIFSLDSCKFPRPLRLLDDDRLSNLIEAISTKRLGLEDVEADIIGESYEYLIRKFAEGGGQSAGEFYTPPEVGTIMSRVLQPEPGMEIYDPTCGSGGLLVKCAIEKERGFSNPRKENGLSRSKSSKPSKNGGLENPPSAPLKLFGQEFTPETWAMANMNMIIHDMEGLLLSDFGYAVLLHS